MAARRCLPLWLKLAFTLWVVVWAPAYWVMLGPQNLLWLCDLATFLICVGLWRESRRLLSMQLLAVLLVGIVWTLDVAMAWLTGMHPIGGTEYMFDPEHPLAAKLMSFYHMALPLVVGFAVMRLGYAPAALAWQTGLTWLVIPLSYLLTEPERNINWVHGPFGTTEPPLDPLLYLFGLMLAWPVLVYLPTHLLLRWLQHNGHLK